MFILLSSIFNEMSRCADDSTSSHSVIVVDRSGKPFGTLSSSPKGDTLFFIFPNQGQYPIGTYVDSLVQSTVASLGNLRINVYQRNCGATVDIATHVAVQDSTNTDLIAVFQGRPEIEVRWNPDNSIQVHHSPLSSEQIFLQKDQSLGRHISFIADLPNVGPSQYLEFSCYNYGATGRAGGWPSELLLRWAGWAQFTSGLWRESRGHWWGSPPYGDDPMGGIYIQSGIDYYENEYSKKKH